MSEYVHEKQESRVDGIWRTAREGDSLPHMNFYHKVTVKGDSIWRKRKVFPRSALPWS